MASVENAKRIRKLIDTAVDQFDSSDWRIIGSQLSADYIIQNHSDLFRALYFGDDGYIDCVAAITNDLIKDNPDNLAWLERYAGIAGEDDSASDDAESKVPRPCSLFSSHKAEEKVVAANLKLALAPLGIEAFVAHEDIKVTNEWGGEIERNLAQCDAFVYLSSPASNASDWCQQEAGWALGRGIPILALCFDTAPVAFLGRRQGYWVGNATFADVAKKVFEFLLSYPPASLRIADGLINQLLHSKYYDESNRLVGLINQLPLLTSSHVDALKVCIETNDQVSGASHGKLPDRIRKIIKEKTSDDSNG